MHGYKTSEARRRANQKWDQNNRERKRYIVARSTTKSFISKKATHEDLLKVKAMVDEKLKEFK